jgi:hypothetical protein
MEPASSERRQTGQQEQGAEREQVETNHEQHEPGQHQHRTPHREHSPNDQKREQRQHPELEEQRPGDHQRVRQARHAVEQVAEDHPDERGGTDEARGRGRRRNPTQLPDERTEHQERDEEAGVPDVPGPAGPVRPVQPVDESQEPVGEEEQWSTQSEELHPSTIPAQHDGDHR